MNRFLSFYYHHIKPAFIQKPLLTKDADVPFFILSSGRSGSTLLRKLLLTNCPVNIPPESNDLIPKLIKFYLRYNHKSWEYIVRSCVNIYNTEEAVIYWKADLREEDLKSILSLHHSQYSLSVIVEFLYKHYAEVHNLKSDLWGDKTPFLIFRLHWILMLYPLAKFIFLIRDGRAVVNSLLKMNKGYTIESATKRWLRAIDSMEKNSKKFQRDQVLYVKYENLVQNTEIEMKKIYSFLNITSQDHKQHELFLGDDFLPHHKNIHLDINSGFMDKWKYELSESEIAMITKGAGKKLKKYNYL